jgi:hypothetical protein
MLNPKTPAARFDISERAAFFLFPFRRRFDNNPVPQQTSFP